MLTPDLIGRVPVIIVAFRNHDDVLECLAALAHVNRATPIEIYICENGGATAHERLIQVLTAEGGPLEEVEFRAEFPRSQVLVATATFGMKGNSSPSGLRVHVGCAKENLGYAGGINSWLKPLADVSGWPGAWVLNPDTEPEPRALAELIIFADRHKRGMVGSRLIETGKPHLVRTRGLAWKKWLATVRAVDK